MKTERLLHECAVPGERKALSDTSDVFVLPASSCGQGALLVGSTSQCQVQVCSVASMITTVFIGVLSFTEQR